MMTVDTDTHVWESDETWDHLREHEKKFRPAALAGKTGQTGDRFWVVEGRLSFRGGLWIDGLYPDGASDMTNLDARLKHMDELGVDVQVLMPTLFISAIFE